MKTTRLAQQPKALLTDDPLDWKRPVLEHALVERRTRRLRFVSSLN
jgi:hypothetical protein